MRRATPWAAAGLTVVLVAMFPANVYAALAGSRTTRLEALLPRTLIQLVFLTATGAVWRSYASDQRSVGQGILST